MAKDREGAPKLARSLKETRPKSGGGGSIWDPSANTFPIPRRVSPVAECFLGRDAWIIPFFRALSAPFVN